MLGRYAPGIHRADGPGQVTGDVRQKNMLRDPTSVLQPSLSPNETLLWCGQPRQGIFLRASDAFLIPFSLLWAGFAIVWEVMAISMLFGSFSSAASAPLGIRLIFPLFGIPFVLVGLYFMFGRFWFDRLLRERTYYGVTNERILIKTGVFSSTLKSLNLRSLADISLSEKSDGFGSISFGGGSPFGWMFSGMSWWPGMPTFSGPVLDSIQNANSVYSIIRDAYAQQK